MKRLASPTQRDAVARAIRDASNGERPLKARISLIADGDVNLSERFVGGEWSQGAQPITLDATIAGHLPMRVDSSRVALDAEIDGIRIPELVGHKTALFPSDNPGTTDLLSSSAASLALGKDAIKFGAFTEYPSHAPHQIVWDVFRRLPYDHSRVEIEEVPGVTLAIRGSTEYPGFHAQEPVGEALTRLAQDQTVGYRYRDTGENGAVAWVPDPLGHGSGVQAHAAWRSYPSSRFPDWQTQRPQPPQERYSAVRVYHNDPATGELLWDVTVEVPYEGNVGATRRPHEGRTLDIPSEDSSDAGPDNGRKRATRAALDIARGISTGQRLTLPAYDPLLEVSDHVRVSETFRDDEGLWDLLWVIRAETYRHLWGSQAPGGTVATEISYTAALLAREKLAVPALIVPAATGGVYLNPPFWGVDGDDLYFTDQCPFSATQGDDLILYDNAPDYAALDGDDLKVSR